MGSGLGMAKAGWAAARAVRWLAPRRSSTPSASEGDRQPSEALPNPLTRLRWCSCLVSLGSCSGHRCESTGRTRAGTALAALHQVLTSVQPGELRSEAFPLNLASTIRSRGEGFVCQHGG